MLWDYDDPPFYGCGQMDPEIRAECESIRSTWSAEERRLRSGHADVDVSLLYVRVIDDYRDHPTALYTFARLDGRGVVSDEGV